MRIDEISIRNFRGFDDKTFTLASRFNLVVGENGSGKTTMLEALSVGLSAFFNGISSSLGEDISSKEIVHLNHVLQNGLYTSEPQFPVQITCLGDFEKSQIAWKIRIENKMIISLHSMSIDLESIIDRIRNRVAAGLDITLPIVGYHCSSRRWQDMQLLPIETLSPASRFEGYFQSLASSSNPRQLLSWFKTMEIIALQESKSIGVLEAVRAAIVGCIEGANHAWFSVKRNDILLRFADREIPFSYLSDGYRNLLGMVADIAMRCAILNPGLGADAIKATPGVVLIDEIDLHLHPKWQRNIVRDLLKVFPKIQFVATTHSPFIIQSLPSEPGIQLINLDDSQANDYSGKSVEDIAEEVQGVEVPQRSQRFLDMMAAAERYYTKLRSPKPTDPQELAQLKRELDDLMMPFSDDPAYSALLKQERAASGIDGVTPHAAS